MADNTPVKKGTQAPSVPVHDQGQFADLFDSARFAQLQRIAGIFASSKLVPQHFQGDMPSCFVGVQMALRLGVDPFMFLQNTYTVHGRPGMEAKLLIALVNQRGPFDGPIQWKWSGTKGKDDWACTAYATHRATGEKCEATVDWATVKAEGWLSKTGSKWNTMPELMFQYRSASWLVNLYCPEVKMGLSTIEELKDIGPQVEIVGQRPLAGGGETKVNNFNQMLESLDEAPPMDLDLSLVVDKMVAIGADEKEEKAIVAFFEQSASDAGMSASDFMPYVLESPEEFFKAYRRAHGVEEDAESAKKNKDDQPSRRRRANRFIVDEKPLITCGIEPKQIEAIRLAMDQDKDFNDRVHKVFSDIGYADLTYLNEDEAAAIMDFLPPRAEDERPEESDPKPEPGVEEKTEPEPAKERSQQSETIECPSSGVIVSRQFCSQKCEDVDCGEHPANQPAEG